MNTDQPSAQDMDARERLRRLEDFERAMRQKYALHSSLATWMVGFWMLVVLVGVLIGFPYACWSAGVARFEIAQQRHEINELREDVRLLMKQLALSQRPDQPKN